MPNTPRFGFPTPTATDPSDVPTHTQTLAQAIEAAIVAHVDATAAHGRTSDLVGRTDTQTLTGKTISSDDNTLSISQGSLRRAILRRNLTTGLLVVSGQTRLWGTFDTSVDIAHSGTWAGGASGQWTFPVTGLYQICGTLEFARSNAAQTGPFRLQLRSGMTSNDGDTGTVHTAVEQGVVANSMPSVMSIPINYLLNATSTSSIWGLCLSNAGSHQVQINSSGSNMHIVYLGPST